MPSAALHGAALALRARPPRRDDVDVDVVIVGGGVNGLGVARDASMRGLKVALFERNDLAFGASGNSSGMIHGGGRYLTYDPQVTETSCTDSGHIQAIAPHLLFRIPFLVPVEDNRKGRFLYPLMDAFFDAYDQYQPLKRGKQHARLTAGELRALEPGLAGDLYGGFSFDEWGIDGARLCLANAVDAMERGAIVKVSTTVERIEKAGTAFVVHTRDRVTGELAKIRASVVVNATGAWAPLTASLAGLPPERARVRPGKGVHVVYDRRLTNYAIYATSIDGRQIFLEPWENMTVLGTTDDDFYGDLDRVRATSEEVRYLVEGVARVFPSIHEARAIGTYAGVRPTLYAYGPSEDNLSREHEIIDHGAHEGQPAPGMYSMIGGKLASYRLFAEEMTDELARVFDLGAPGFTHTAKLPGGDRAADPFAIASRIGVDAVTARRLVYRHGSRAERIEERVLRRPREGLPVCVCEPVIEAEVRYVLEHELARSVADVARRTRLGLGACGGMRCAARCGQIVADELDLDPREGLRQACSFLERQALVRSVALGPEQARQEALAIAAVRAEIGVAPIEETGETEESAS